MTWDETRAFGLEKETRNSTGRHLLRSLLREACLHLDESELGEAEERRRDQCVGNTVDEQGVDSLERLDESDCERCLLY
jgi:hypothetical protein